MKLLPKEAFMHHNEKSAEGMVESSKLVIHAEKPIEVKVHAMVHCSEESAQGSRQEGLHK